MPKKMDFTSLSYNLYSNTTYVHYVTYVQSPERKKEKAQWRRTINFWRDIFASVTLLNICFSLM